MLITKSEFLIYLEAPLHLWALKHGQVPEQERDEYLEHLAEQGYEVEEWALKYLHEHLAPLYNATGKDFLVQPTVTTGNFQARADILIRKHGTDLWDIYEIKSSTKVKEEHLYDVTFQNLVFEEQYTIGDKYIIHVNREYVRHGEIDVNQLLAVENVTGKIAELKPQVKKHMTEALRVVGLDKHEGVKACLTPKVCPCLDICHPGLPDYSIFDIAFLKQDKKEQLLSQEILSIHGIPKDFPLSKSQRLQVDVAQSGKPYVDQKKITKELNLLKYPLCFIDYETFNPAVPLHDGYRPYDHMPFQYSLHIVRSADSEPEHYEFLHIDISDPVSEFLKTLKNKLPEVGSIIVWNKAFEGNINSLIAKLYPEYKDFCLDMNKRLYDLMLIFQKQWHSHPNFKGSFSIKNVLPSLVPELNYEEMEVAEGATAMAIWKQLVFDPHLDKKERERLQEAMLRYCEMDSMAMVKIWEYLKNLSM